MKMYGVGNGRWMAACGAMLVAAAGLAGCSGSGGSRVTTSGGGGGWGTIDRPEWATRTVVLDGDVSEWPTQSAALADEDYVYFRVQVAESRFPLQAGPETLELYIDADADGTTGAAVWEPSAAAGLGADLVVRFAPRRGSDSATGSGVAVSTLSGGAESRVSHTAVDLSGAPTHAADWYELRLSRHAAGLDGAAQSGLLGAGARAIFVLRDAGGAVVGWSDPMEIAMPPASAGRPLADAVIPEKPAGAVRVLSYNVLRGSPASKPEMFARIFQAVNADVILVQEWDDATSGSLEAWFTALVPSETGWHARTSAGRGVAIISRYPIAPGGPDELMTADGEGNPIRFVAGRVQTPAGDVLAASVHMKCCGTTESSEDLRRTAEAAAINAAIRAELEAGGAAAVALVGGDYNLVGSRTPLEVLGAGKDGGRDFVQAHPFVLGDSTMYTWADANSAFPPGRLDWITYAGSGSRAVQGFVLDTARLSDAALLRLGLDRGDTASASDHLPVVVDFVPR